MNRTVHKIIMVILALLPIAVLVYACVANIGATERVTAKLMDYGDYIVEEDEDWYYVSINPDGENENIVDTLLAFFVDRVAGEIPHDSLLGIGCSFAIWQTYFIGLPTMVAFAVYCLFAYEVMVFMVGMIMSIVTWIPRKVSEVLMP